MEPRARKELFPATPATGTRAFLIHNNTGQQDIWGWLRRCPQISSGKADDGSYFTQGLHIRCHDPDHLTSRQQCCDGALSPGFSFHAKGCRSTRTLRLDLHSVQRLFAGNPVAHTVRHGAPMIANSEKSCLLTFQAHQGTDEVYANMALQTVNTYAKEELALRQVLYQYAKEELDLT